MGVMVPDEEVIVPWARQNDISGSFKDICAREVSILNYYLYVHVLDKEDLQYIGISRLRGVLHHVHRSCE